MLFCRKSANVRHVSGKISVNIKKLEKKDKMLLKLQLFYDIITMLKTISEVIMEKVHKEVSRAHLGVNFGKMGSKYALLDAKGNPFANRYNLTEDQVNAIYAYMSDGLTEGMFSKVEPAMYGVALGYHYDALIREARTKAEVIRLQNEWKSKDHSLRRYDDTPQNQLQ